MSTRHIRRMKQQISQHVDEHLPSETDSDTDFEPSYVAPRPRNTFMSLSGDADAAMRAPQPPTDSDTGSSSYLEESGDTAGAVPPQPPDDNDTVTWSSDKQDLGDASAADPAPQSPADSDSMPDLQDSDDVAGAVSSPQPAADSDAAASSPLQPPHLLDQYAEEKAIQDLKLLRLYDKEKKAVEEYLATHDQSKGAIKKTFNKNNKNGKKNKKTKKPTQEASPPTLSTRRSWDNWGHSNTRVVMHEDQRTPASSILNPPLSKLEFPPMKLEPEWTLPQLTPEVFSPKPTWFQPDFVPQHQLPLPHPVSRPMGPLPPKPARLRPGVASQQRSPRKLMEDDVSRALREVRQMLGEPKRPQLPPPRSPTVAEDPLSVLLSVNHVHLKPENELHKLLGPPEEEENVIKRRTRPDIMRALRRQIGVVDMKNERAFFKGITMEKVCEMNDVKYFKFEHSQRYESNLRKLIAEVRVYNFAPPVLETLNGDTFEGHLQLVDSFFLGDLNNLASDGIECAVSYIQSVYAPSFVYTDGMCRVEYSHVENRPFHVLLLKYLHLLSNKVCHRTALEIAKLMLQLDPSDPLAVIFIIDTLAIRAREFKWLADIYPIWVRVKQVDRLFHMQYSHALAKYHLHLVDKTQGSLQEATRFLEQAILRYPNVATRLMQLCKKDTSVVETHEMHITALKTTSGELMGLQNLYCMFIYHKWREDGIDWLVATYHKLCTNFHTTEREIVKRGVRERAMVRKLPLQIIRHLSVISAMSNLLVEGAVPEVPLTIAFNPYPHSGGSEDTREYYRRPPPPRQQHAAGLLRSFVHSFMPQGPQPGDQP